MENLGRLLVGLGSGVIVIGLLLIFAERLHLPVGRLPGDISYRGKNFSIYFPLASCLIISLVLSLILWLLNRR
jgi:hypothetical protein